MKLNDIANVGSINVGGIVSKVKGIGSLKEKFSSASSKVKENLSNTIQKTAEETTELIESVKYKNSKMKNLEELLGLDKSLLVSSEKGTNLYKPAYNKMIIIEKDSTETPTAITIKEGAKVSLYIVKYQEHTPFVYPAYEEKGLPGNIIYMDNDEIWYRDNNTLTVGHKANHAMDFLTIRLAELNDFSEENLVSYIKTYCSVIKSPRISKLINENNIKISDILRITDTYILIRNSDQSYNIYIYDYKIQQYNTLSLTKLPNIQLESFDVLLTPDMLSFIKENNYPIEQFEEKSGYIEYNKEVGRSKVSMLRFKI